MRDDTTVLSTTLCLAVYTPLSNHSTYSARRHIPHQDDLSPMPPQLSPAHGATTEPPMHIRLGWYTTAPANIACMPHWDVLCPMPPLPPPMRGEIAAPPMNNLFAENTPTPIQTTNAPCAGDYARIAVRQDTTLLLPMATLRHIWICPQVCAFHY